MFTTEPLDDDVYFPDYLFLMCSLVASGLAPDSGYLRPDLASTPNTDVLSQLPCWVRILLSLRGEAGMVVRVGALAEANHQHWKLVEASEQRKLNESIDRLLLSNNALYTFLSEHFGVTETDVHERIDETFSAELERFAAELRSYPTPAN